MKKFFTLLTFVLLTVVGKSQDATPAQQPGKAQDLKAITTSSHLELSWQTALNEVSNYWEVQGSADGHTFSTIGLVLGGESGEKTMTFSFKQKSKKIKPGLKYYRVLHIASETSAYASSVVSPSK